MNALRVNLSVPSTCATLPRRPAGARVAHRHPDLRLRGRRRTTISASTARGAPNKIVVVITSRPDNRLYVNTSKLQLEVNNT